jgi:hypothetical protein
MESEKAHEAREAKNVVECALKTLHGYFFSQKLAHSFTRHHHHIASSLPAPPVLPAGLHFFSYHTTLLLLISSQPSSHIAFPPVLRCWLMLGGLGWSLLPNSPIHPSPHCSSIPSTRRCLHISTSSARSTP